MIKPIKRVLLIKLTSMGDLMHILPAISDAQSVFPDIEFDWVADEAFADVASLHPAVKNIIPSAHRRWRKNVLAAFTSGQLKAFYQQLNHHDYDIVLDAQNNLKSAFVSLLRRGPAHGVDAACVSEKPAQLAYRFRHHVSKEQHALVRQRELMAKALGYAVPDTAPNFGVDTARMPKPALALPDNYLVFVHNASWATKLWPEEHWHALISLAEAAGYSVLLPCGNAEELQRAERLTEGHSRTIAMPRIRIAEVAHVLLHAKGAVSCDTGLCHLSALLNIPTVSFYGPTDVNLIGAVGENQQHIIASEKTFSCAPCYSRSCERNPENSDDALCMRSFTPEQVWQDLTALLV